MRGLFKKGGSIIAGSFESAPPVLLMILLVISFGLLSEVNSQGFNSDISWEFIDGIKLGDTFPDFCS